MKKKLLAMALVTVLTAGLVACGGGSSSGAGTDTAASDASGAELLAKSWDTIYVDYEMMVDGNAGGWLADNPVEGPIEQVELRVVDAVRPRPYYNADDLRMRESLGVYPPEVFHRTIGIAI